MDLYKYYRENKDEINSSIMEIATDLAALRLINNYQNSFNSFIELVDPNDPDSETRYKEEFQDEFNRYYDEEYNRVARLIKFNYAREEGIVEE